MKITIDTDVLRKEHLSFHQFLVLLMANSDMDYKKVLDSLIELGLGQRDVYNPYNLVLDDNLRSDIAKILVESDKNVSSCNIDFDSIAVKMRDLYPKGFKPGTTHFWRDSVAVIANKLKTLVCNYNFVFTEKEALAATKEYLDSYKADKSRMKLLKYFILKIDDDGAGNKQINSEFMSIIENNRERESHAVIN